MLHLISARTEEIRIIPGNQTTLDLKDLTVGVSYGVSVTALVGENEGGPVTVYIKPGNVCVDVRDWYLTVMSTPPSHYLLILAPPKRHFTAEMLYISNSERRLGKGKDYQHYYTTEYLYVCLTVHDVTWNSGKGLVVWLCVSSLLQSNPPPEWLIWEWQMQTVGEFALPGQLLLGQPATVLHGDKAAVSTVC